MLVKLSDITVPVNLLRQVDKDTVEYLELKASMASAVGQTNSILLRPVNNDLHLVDGLHRLTVAEDLGWDTIEATVKPLTDEEALIAQLTNAFSIQPTRSEYGRHLQRILLANKHIGIPELVKITSKSATWIKCQLALNDLSYKAQVLVDRGEITASNAYRLAKLPQRVQPDFLVQAMTLKHEDFYKVTAEKIKELMVARKDETSLRRIRRLGESHLRARHVRDIRQELKSRVKGSELIADHNPKTLLEALHLGIRWAYQDDTL